MNMIDYECGACGEEFDPYNGQGDGIGSCDCPRGDCGAPDWSALCTCPTEDEYNDEFWDELADEPEIPALQPGQEPQDVSDVDVQAGERDG